MWAGKKVCGAVVWLWVCAVGVCRWATGRVRGQQHKPKTGETTSTNVGTWPSTGQEMDGEWDESWSKMEPFSVTVVPSDPQSGTEPEQSNADLFQDMQPVIKKARKVYVGAGHSTDTQSVGDRHKFAVDTEFKPDGVELGVWEEQEGGWEEEMGKEEGVLVEDSREVLLQKKREEREKRRKLQEALRFSQRRQPGWQALGTRLSDST